MMRGWNHEEFEPPEVQAQRAYDQIYHAYIGGLNRAERRTVQGRRIVADARVKALEAKVRVLEERLEDLRRAGLL